MAEKKMQAGRVVVKDLAFRLLGLDSLLIDSLGIVPGWLCLPFGMNTASCALI
mgnify:CR=1